MPKLLAGFVLCLLPFSTPATGPETTFYVSPKGNDAWSGRMPDPDPDKGDGPFATLVRARDEVRKLVARGLKTDVTVKIRAGTYHLKDGLVFTPADSGTQQHRILYAAFPGEVVKLVGGVRLGDFTPHKGRTVVAGIPKGLSPKQAFESGIRLELARAPNKGYLRLEKPAHTQKRSGFIYRTGDLSPGSWDIAGAVVNLWPHHDWFNHNIAIESVDAAKRHIVLATGPRTINPGNRYFVKNVLALLDAPGECRIDLKERKFYAWPRKSAGDIVLSTAENVISLRGDEKTGATVRNLHFRDLDLSICNGDAILVSAAEDCSFSFCLIENAEQCGVLVRNHAQRINIYGCLIRFHGLHGVHLQGMGPGRPDVNKHHRVENCHIHHCGRLVGHGYGVRVSGSGHNKILHNHIHHMPRYATTLKGIRFHAIKNKPKGMTFENRFDYYHSRNNLFAYNDIHDTNMDSQDTGAMESWGPGRDNVYDHNLIRGTGNDQFNLQSGMYLDDASDYFTVTNNIIYGVVGTNRNQPIYAKGIGNRFINNILVVGPHCDSAISSFFMADERCDHHEYLRNIVYFSGKAKRPSKRGIYHFQNWTKDRVTVCDYNLYFDASGEPLRISGRMPGNGKDRSYAAWKKELGGKFDRHSVVADPLFRDPKNHDYRLKPGSPALNLGFKPIDTSRIGLKPDFPKRFERE